MTGRAPEKAGAKPAGSVRKTNSEPKPKPNEKLFFQLHFHPPKKVIAGVEKTPVLALMLLVLKENQILKRKQKTRVTLTPWDRQFYISASQAARTVGY